MQTNVLEYLENTVDRVPDKTAFADEESALYRCPNRPKVLELS